jgi:hypothetical protein
VLAVVRFNLALTVRPAVPPGPVAPDLALALTVAV